VRKTAGVTVSLSESMIWMLRSDAIGPMLGVLRPSVSAERKKSTPDDQSDNQESQDR
jgi:hypothetical protein